MRGRGATGTRTVWRGVKALLTGATGFVGQEVLRQLCAAGHTVRIVVRNPCSRTAGTLAARVGAEVCAGDLLNATSLPSALAGVEAVIHLVGIISEVGQQTFENVHTRATRNVVAAAQQAGVRRFVQMSALGTRPHAAARYHQTKWAAEEIVRASGLDWTIFRPSLIYGPRDHFVNLFARMAKFSPVLPVVGHGRSLMQPVAVEAVGRCFVGALHEPKSIGQTYDLCGSERLTMAEILQVILDASGHKRWIVQVPLGMARVQAAFLEALYPTLLRRAPPFNRDQLLMLQEDNVGDPRPAAELFGLKQTPFREGVANCLRRAA